MSRLRAWVAEGVRALTEDIYEIFHKFQDGRPYVEAKLDLERIQLWKDSKCVWYQGEWRSATGAAKLANGSSTELNGWKWWRYWNYDYPRPRGIEEFRPSILL